MATKKRRHWTHGLTKAQKTHLREWGGRTKGEFLRTRKEQRATMEKEGTVIEPCWECRMIALKLGIEAA